MLRASVVRTPALQLSREAGTVGSSTTRGFAFGLGAPQWLR